MDKPGVAGQARPAPAARDPRFCRNPLGSFSECLRGREGRGMCNRPSVWNRAARVMFAAGAAMTGAAALITSVWQAPWWS